MSESRMRVVLLLLLTFTAGAAAGVAADRLSLLPGVAGAEESGEARRPPPGERRGTRQTTIERFADDLGLTAAQRETIEGVLERYRANLKEMREEIRPRFHALVDSVRTEIEATLTPRQVTEYRALLEERRARREHEESEADERAKNADGQER
ncbi:MAG: hypothetical protein ACE5HP_11415 [Gemmatimonadota bacterium]